MRRSASLSIAAFCLQLASPAAAVSLLSDDRLVHVWNYECPCDEVAVPTAPFAPFDVELVDARDNFRGSQVSEVTSYSITGQGSVSGFFEGQAESHMRIDFEVLESTPILLDVTVSHRAVFTAGCAVGADVQLTGPGTSIRVLAQDGEDTEAQCPGPADDTQSVETILEPGVYELFARANVYEDDLSASFDVSLIFAGPCGSFVCPACSDGVDNDGDGKIDHPTDPGCRSPDAAIEDPQCDDGLDNDGDGRCDGAASTCSDGSTPGDPDCVLARFRDTELPVCSDGIDNDRDGLVDLADPQCASTTQRSETWAGCGLGWELSLLLPLLGLIRQRARRAARRG